jgi:hypothetical protein
MASAAEKETSEFLLLPSKGVRGWSLPSHKQPRGCRRPSRSIVHTKTKGATAETRAGNDEECGGASIDATLQGDVKKSGGAFPVELKNKEKEGSDREKSRRGVRCRRWGWRDTSHVGCGRARRQVSATPERTARAVTPCFSRTHPMTNVETKSILFSPSQHCNNRFTLPLFLSFSNPLLHFTHPMPHPPGPPPPPLVLRSFVSFSCHLPQPGRRATRRVISCRRWERERRLGWSRLFCDDNEHSPSRGPRQDARPPERRRGQRRDSSALIRRRRRRRARVRGTQQPVGAYNRPLCCFTRGALLEALYLRLQLRY